MLSNVHFAVSCESAFGRLRDMGSTNGTFLNGKQVEEALLSDGDRIVAGQTTFCVGLEDVDIQSLVAGASRRAPPEADILKTVETPLAELQADLPSREDGLTPTKTIEYPLDDPAFRQPVEPAPVPPIHRFAPTHGVSRLTLRTLTSPSLKKVLKPGQSITVGRTVRADFMVEGDEEMSAAHFKVCCEADGCRAEDLGSSNGTFVNQERVEEHELADGDRVIAGGTTFLISIVASAPTGSAEQQNVPTYLTEQCSSGIYRHQGDERQPDPLSVVRALADILPLYLIVDFEKLNRLPPPNVTFLFDWIPRHMAALMSPVFLSARQSGAMDLFEQGWGHDALVCIFSAAEPADMLRNLRFAARGQHSAAALPEEKHVFSNCRPSFLGPLIQESMPEFAAYLFSSIDALMLEAEEGAGWELLTASPLTSEFRRIGFAASETE